MSWLLGWDSLVPELNWKLNFDRVLGGAWQEYQGLGLPGGMAHLADLPRMMILWVINLAVPTEYIRWIWHYGMLFFGPIGVWYLGKKVWKWGNSACLAASMFYLLNLATVQYFFVPYEAFSSFYGFLPWLIAVFVMYLEHGKKNDLWKVIGVGLLASSAFYVQTLFVVYVIILGVLSLGYLKQWKRLIILWLSILVINSFWLLPVIYGVVQTGSTVGIAKINSIGSPETALMNNGFGNWYDVTMLKGYWLEYIEWLGGSEWGRLMQDWWTWSGKVLVTWIGWGLFAVASIGLVIGGWRKSRLSWVVLLVLTYGMVASFHMPFGAIYGWLVNNIPLFGEMFRSVFTKWSIPLALTLSIGVGSLVAQFKKKWARFILVSLIVVGCAGITWPVFTHGFVSEKMKVGLPNEYQKLFGFMKGLESNGRVAYLPAQDMWSWKYTDWGYRGSGFLWYGIEQPILDRAFDVWSPYNEGFYNQISTALYGCESGQAQISNSQILKLGCAEQVERVLQKYDVRYVLLDESVIAPGQGEEILRIEETKKLAEELGWIEKFHEGFLTVWEVENSQITNSQILKSESQFISAPTEYTWVEADPPSPKATEGHSTTKTKKDVIFDDVGTYISENSEYSENSERNIILPFADLMREEVVGIEYRDQGTVISTTVSSDTATRDLVIPEWKVGEIVRVDFVNNEVLPAYYVNGDPGPRFLGDEKPREGESYLYARVSEGEEWEEYRAGRKYVVSSEKIEIEVKGEPFVYDFGRQGQGSIGNCDVLKRGMAQKQRSTYTADERGAVCDYVVMDELFARVPHLMRVVGENKAGRSLKFFLYNTGSERNDIEYLMDRGKFDQTFSLLPWDWDGHYSINIETRSFGQYAENRMDKVEARYAPIEKIARAKLVRSDQEVVSINNKLEITHVKKTGTWLYGLGVRGEGLIRLSQGYDEGWVGVLISNHKFSNSQILEHVKVDGWANGWMVGEQIINPKFSNSQMDTDGEAQVVVIFYWPQLLQYLGFVLFGTTLVLVMMKKDQ